MASPWKALPWSGRCSPSPSAGSTLGPYSETHGVAGLLPKHRSTLQPLGPGFVVKLFEVLKSPFLLRRRDLRKPGSSVSTPDPSPARTP